MNQQETIKRLLSETRTIAVVGFSSKQDRPGYIVPKYLQTAGYRIIPVNPSLDEALGENAYPDLVSIGQPVDVVEVFRRAEELPAIVQDAIAIGAKGVWMQLGIVNEEAAQMAREAGLDVVMDACMKVEHTRWIMEQDLS